MNPRNALGLTLAVLAFSSLVACATGSDVTEQSDGGTGGEGGTGEGDATTDGPRTKHSDGSTGKTDAKGHEDARSDGSTGSDSGSPTAPIGGSCATKPCEAPGTCTPLGMGKYCTEPCPASACPAGTYCSIINGTDLCVPDLGQECDSCRSQTDCKLPSDACLTSPTAEGFCARDCTVDSTTCPAGFACETKADYETFDAGVGDAGDAGSPSSGDGGGPTKWCVPTGDGTCACTPSINGATQTCSITNMYGTCTGLSTCDGAKGMWGACPQTPSAEICNGIDDNCNGQVDEGDPNTLCSFMGSPPPNAAWACTSGKCTVGVCNAGWADFPPGETVAQGCSCPVNPTEPNALCAQAAAAGSVTSVGGVPLVITGTLSSVGDVNVWAFTSTDVNEMTTNSLHVTISFSAPTPNNEFVFDVIRGATCNDTPSGGSTNITSYDWCVNTFDGTTGEAPCGPDITNHCTDESSPYYLRVYRAAGATPSCTPYEITITGGGGLCDTTVTCM